MLHWNEMSKLGEFVNDDQDNNNPQIWEGLPQNPLIDLAKPQLVWVVVVVTHQDGYGSV
jgi:hypothetical protein